MANKDRNKRSARKARAAKRAEAEARAAEAGSEITEDKAPAKAVAKEKKAAKGKPGLFGRIKNYFGAVRTEMHRVVWPSRKELKDYTIGVLVMLVIFGVCIWAVDNLVVLGLTSFASLRG